MRRSLTLYLIWLLLIIPATTKAEVKLSHLFGDHMVLQQNSSCPIWGWADNGEQITITCSWGATASAIPDINGKWQANLQTPKYGGPYTIEVKGKNTIQIQDVMIGEVWLASGQSNMELPMSGWGAQDTVKGAYNDIQNSTNNNIRFISVKQIPSLTKLEDFEGWWATARPETVREFSAFAYYYAKKLYEETGIPIGIIHSSWGGCLGESWVAEEYLKKIPGFKQKIMEFDNFIPQRNKLYSWIEKHSKIVPSNDWYTRYTSMEFHDDECAKLSYDDTKWLTMRLPCWYDDGNNLGAYDGMLWFRRWVDIPGAWQGKKLILKIGPIDDMDETFVNGERIGANLREGLWNVDRTYEIYPGLVRAGEMLLAIRLIDNGNGGGIWGKASEMKIYPEGKEDEAIYIAGDWKYLPTGEFHNGMLYEYDYKTREYYNRPQVNITLNNKSVTALYNGMINPLLPYKLAGTIWYQGEANVGRSEEYLQIMQQLIQCWRDGFKNPDMKFYYAQIASYEYGEGVPAPQLREAQRRVMDLVPNTGMCCLLDLGKKETKHPSQKKEAAERLALWALNDVYNKKCETSGPLFSGYEINKDKIILSFTHTSGGLVVKGPQLTDFEIGDSKGNFVPANAKVVGDKIEVSAPNVTAPKNVRYCWKNYYKELSLYNGAGLPASSFTTEKKLKY